MSPVKVLSLIEKEFEDLEFWYPMLRLMEEGIQVDVAGPIANIEYRGKYGVSASSTVAFDDLTLGEYSGLLIPGGWAPDKLRRFPQVLDILRHFDNEGKVIGQICHAGWVLISADLLRGRTVTSTPGIKDDMINAGAKWIDEAVVVDGNLVSSRKPGDLPYYMKAFIQALSKQNS